MDVANATQPLLSQASRLTVCDDGVLAIAGGVIMVFSGRLVRLPVGEGVG